MESLIIISERLQVHTGARLLPIEFFGAQAWVKGDVRLCLERVCSPAYPVPLKYSQTASIRTTTQGHEFFLRKSTKKAKDARGFKNVVTLLCGPHFVSSEEGCKKIRTQGASDLSLVCRSTKLRTEA